jgi:Raf kinase inhibitor-like YbhB/YbcL family protein
MLTLESPDFVPSGAIPAVHTCEGKDLSPELKFGGVPQGAKSLALVVHDPDAPDPKAPRMDYVHWVLYNIPSSAKGLPQGGTLPAGTLQGVNDWKRTGYGGPCPPIGRHRYYFVLYALDTVLPDLGSPNRQSLEKAMAGHLLGKAELMGTYQKAS